MFKAAKRKIVITILAILCTVLVGTLGMIYVSSFLSVTAQNYEVLEAHAEMLINSSNPDDPEGDRFFEGGSGLTEDGERPDDQKMMRDDPENPGLRKGKIQRHLKVNVFYSVKLTEDGTAQILENTTDGIYTDDELVTLAKKVQSGSEGRTGDLLYCVSRSGEEIFVCFMDNIVITDSFMRISLFTLLFGLIAIAAITIISVRIADRIVSPMEENYLKQKQFTADAGHELKSPISAMAANIELLQREVGDNQWLANISYENERMRDLVTELLELARNENKKTERKTTDLSRLVNGVILPMEASAFEKNILIESEIAEGVTSVIDAKGISQLTAILVDNAISHTECPDGTIEEVYIKLNENKGTAILSVSNPGEAIPENERDKLFERFYRTDRSHEFSGHYGLGLAIAKAICDANHAKISIDCRDGMVTFSVRFPAK